MTISSLIQTDFYKASHYKMYPEGTSKIYSNFTPRKSRIKGIDGVVVFGLQYFILEYLISQWNYSFFHTTMRERVKDASSEEWKECKAKTIAKYKRMMDATLGKDSVDTKHLEELWDLGYLPLEIKALPEGLKLALLKSI